MIEAKHTPGPWKAKQVRTSGDYRIRAENGEEIADVFEDAYDGTAESNARLIVAAPEMLEALQKIKTLADVQDAFERVNPYECLEEFNDKLDEVFNTAFRAIRLAALTEEP